MSKRTFRPEADLGQPGPEPLGASDRPKAGGSDAAPDDRPAVTADAPTSPSLIWPPPDDELNGWEVLQLHSTGHTVIEPGRYTPEGVSPVAPAPDPLPGPSVSSTRSQSGAVARPEPVQSAMPGRWPERGENAGLPETELIEPLSPDAASASWPALPVRPSLVSPREPNPDDTDPGLMTRILPVPDFARRAAQPPPPPAVAPRLSMEDTLPTGIPRSQLPPAVLARPSNTSTSSVGEGSDDATRVMAVSPVARGRSHDDRAWSRERVTAEPPVPAYVPPVPDYQYQAPPAPQPQPPPPSAVSPTPDPGGLRRTGNSQQFWTVALWLLAIVAVLLVGFLVFRTLSPAAAVTPPAGLAIESSPSGAEVAINGEVVGKTPFRGEVAAGTHDIEVRSGTARKAERVTVQAGTLSSHAFDFSPTPPAPTGTAAIEIRSDPPGARVIIGGLARGVTPLVVTGLTAGRHQVQVSGPFRPVTRTVTVAAGQQALLVITPARPDQGGPNQSGDRQPDGLQARTGPPPAPTRPATGNGYVTIQSPIILRIVRNGEFVGTSDDVRLSLPPGTQVIALENESVGFRDVRSVDVLPGRTVVVLVELPQGALNINARPWAEVFVNGQRVGETPVAQLALPIGPHEIVFRHPTHGERRVTAIVRVGPPGRAFVDFTR